MRIQGLGVKSEGEGGTVLQVRREDVGVRV